MMTPSSAEKIFPDVQASIPYARQDIDEDDIAAVTSVLRSPYLTTGPQVPTFENEFAHAVDATFAIAVSSGTAGLHLAVLAAGIKPGDEVLVPALSFLASANCVRYAGAIPVFVDCLADGFNLDPEDARKKISKRTKAIISVDFAGQAADLSAINKLAKTHGLIHIEDAAHSLGATFGGRKVGALADMTVFSFHPVKIITTGEGSMVTTNNEGFARKLRTLRHHGIDTDVAAREEKVTWKYDMTELGFNYRLTDFQCALGRSQLKRLDSFLKRREEIARLYDSAFSKLEAIELPSRPASGDRHAWHLYILRLHTHRLKKSRDEIFSALRARGIGVHVHYRPIHLHSYYASLGYREGSLPVAENLFQRTLTIPMYAALTDREVERVQLEVKQVLSY